MSNSRTRRTARRVDPYEVYDALPAPIRAALQEGPQEWDSVWCRTRLRKYSKLMPKHEAIERVTSMVMRAHLAEIDEARPWQEHSRIPKAKRTPSPHLLAKATMQMSGRPA